jgi:hypothetical protein
MSFAQEEMWSNGTVEVTLEHDSDEFKGKIYYF